MTRQPLISNDWMQGGDALSMIPTARQAKRSEPKRNRVWEKKHPLRSHRIPAALHSDAKNVRLAVDGLAQRYMTTHSDIAAALMEFALRELRGGKLQLEARPNPEGRKMKITWSIQGDHWPQEIPQPRKKKSAALPKGKGVFLGYRWGNELDRQIIAEAQLGGATSGEVLVRLMQHALEAYRVGRLRLAGASVVVRQKVHATW